MKRFTNSISTFRPDIFKVLLTILVTVGSYMTYAQPCVTEVCNEIDDDCDGLVDEGVQTTYYINFDGDLWLNAYVTILACTAPLGWIPDPGPGDFYEENDTDPYVGPGCGGCEVCNGIDDDGNGLIDMDDPGLVGAIYWYADSDGDGYGDPYTSVIACTQPSGYVPWPNYLDCDDTDPNVRPGAQEICNGIDDDCDGLIEQEICNEIDDDCDGLIDEGVQTTYYLDWDGDGAYNYVTILACTPPPGGWFEGPQFCPDCCFDYNDYDNLIGCADGGEWCNGIDDDGNGLVDDDDPGLFGAVWWYADNDGDGYGDPNTSVYSCMQPSGYVSNPQDPNNIDCDDTDPAVYPGAQEICNGIDDDCDGLIDGDDDSVTGQLIWFLDNDNDGYGNGVWAIACTQPSGYVGTGTDCDDSNAAIHPDAPETMDGLDNDCDGLVDEEMNLMSIEAGDCELVLFGYAPEACQTLTVTVSGGIAPYTYLWSNGATTQSTDVCPEETTIYSVVVTDNNGNTAQDNVTVQVIDVRCGNNNAKVLVCHIPPDNPDNAQVICITPSAIPDHLEHGCYVGVCDAPDPCEGGVQSLTGEQVDAEIDAPRQVFSNAFRNNHEDAVSFMVRPNPVDDQLEVQTNLVPGTISLMDISGKVILQQGTTGHKNSVETVSLAEGIYFIRVESGTHCYTKSVVIMH